MVALILVCNAAGSTLYFLWSLYARAVGPTTGRSMAFILVDLFFAFALFRQKLWARPWVIARSVLGALLWVGVSVYQRNPFGAVTQVVFFGAIIALLSGWVAKPVARVLGVAAIGLIAAIGFNNLQAIANYNKIAAQVINAGAREYVSEKFGYRITTPENWKIIKRSDFGKVDKSLLTTDAEIAMINKEGTGYCLLIPEELKGYGTAYDLQMVRNAVLENAKRIKGVEVLENNLASPYGEAGFQIKYGVWSEGFHYRYLVLYSVYQRTGIQLLVWAFDSNADSVFSDVVKNVAGKVTFK
ncbi:MAG TPA: hypothetical protein VMD52_08175 [Patescibacteria group bacterium]|nr:hypothetical protein [Patescibacteria group bacterium]